jgi:ubiquinol-cytochrome c reductase cytochrome b subunit
MDEEPLPVQYREDTNALKTLWNKVGFHWLPSYGNKIFFSLGFMALTCLVMLALTGMLMGFMGQTWWLTDPWGVYVRSVHLWTVQAFIFILVLHILVAVTTGGFRAPRRMVWVFGAAIFCLALIQSEFGYGLRGDFSSQYRAVSGADFWNGSYLGYWLNPLNYTQSFVIHVAIIPITLILIFVMHYVLERTYGLSLPFRKDIPVKMVPADHKKMFMRGGALVTLIFSLAFFFHSPYVPAVRIADIAGKDPDLVSTTLMQEFQRASDTATYFDSIDPYTFDTRQIFVVIPYEKSGLGSLASTTDSAAMINTLMPMARSGLYESLLAQENPNANNTYTLRFLSDMGVLEDKAVSLGFNTAVWGMAKDETGNAFGFPPGSWWFAPIGMLNSSLDLLNNPNGDRDAGLILGVLMLLFILFPYIPYLNRLPEVLHIAPLIWKTKEEKEN